MDRYSAIKTKELFNTQQPGWISREFSWKKPVLRGYTLYNSIYVPFLKWQNYTNGEQVCGCQELGRGLSGKKENGAIEEGGMRDPCVDGILYLDSISVSIRDVMLYCNFARCYHGGS